MRQKRLARDVDVDYSLLSRDPDLFTVSAEPLPGIEIHDLEKAVEEELEQLRNTRVGDHELEKAKNQLEADFILGQDSLFYQAMLLARYEIASDWRDIDDYVPAVRKVTPEAGLLVL